MRRRLELDQTTGIGSHGTFWRPVGGRWAELFALVFMRDLGSSPVTASIKKPRMRSYRSACTVWRAARDIFTIWRGCRTLLDSGVFFDIETNRFGMVKVRGGAVGHNARKR